jgi:hypothetical protein
MALPSVVDTAWPEPTSPWGLRVRTGESIGMDRPPTGVAGVGAPDAGR